MEKIEATLVGRDPRTDLAVIRIPPDDVEAVATLGDSDNLLPGRKAIAIGNPFGLSHTLTTGIISALHRSIWTEDGNEIEDLIQMDAAINPGNSGGPLLDSNGHVIVFAAIRPDQDASRINTTHVVVSFLLHHNPVFSIFDPE